MELEKRVENLENLVTSLIKRIDKDKYYDTADKDGIRITTSENDAKLKAGVEENDAAIVELAEIISEMEVQ